MDRALRLAALILPAALVASAQTILPWEEKADACTSIMVGKRASSDGSVITSHTCDGQFRSWIDVVPAASYTTGTKRPVRWGTLHTGNPKDSEGTKVKGEVPQVEKTFAYLNGAYPFLNEKQLAMGETTISGRKELVNTEGLFLVEELQAIAMERCTTAREAIALMGRLAEEYGYGDGGECLTVADPKEVWHFEIFGPGKGKPGAVWAAVRIPDDHVGVSANTSRIGAIDLKQPDRYMASDNVFSRAQELGYWDPAKEPFRFWKAYGGVKKPFTIRDYFILSRLAPGLKLSLEMEELPFTVKPEKSVGARDVAAFLRQTYEGTEYDRTRNLMAPKSRNPRDPAPKEGEKPEIVTSPLAQPWLSREAIALYNALKTDVIPNFRPIAVPQCAYSTVIQCRGWLPDEVGGVAWFSLDNPAQSPRIPLFAGATQVPESFTLCMNKKFRTDCAGWHFRRANKLATVRWGQTKEKHEAAVLAWEEKAFVELPDVERRVKELQKSDPTGAKGRTYLTQYTADFAHAAMRQWWEMGDRYWELFGKGF